MTHSEHSLGDVIRQYRIERGFTQNELSEKISLSSRQIMSLEGDQCLPTFETLSKLVQVLNIPGDRIFILIRMKTVQLLIVSLLSIGDVRPNIRRLFWQAQTPWFIIL